MHEDIINSLRNILESIIIIENRFIEIIDSNDFINNDDIGLMKLDSIAMRLQIIGENVKKIYKLDSKFLESYPGIEWKNIIRLREIIFHHYDILDSEILYDICKNKIPILKEIVESILKI